MLMKNTFLSPRRVAGFTGLLLMLLTTEANAGSLDAPAAPSVAASAMFTLTDLYNRLNAGTPGAKRSGPFAEPTAGPGATGYTLDQIMALMPAVNADAATTAEVVSGKKFWGLGSGTGEWGLQTGAVAAGADVIGTNGSLSMAIPAGLYSGSNFAIAGDTNLSAGNIKSGVTIFGVNGSAAVASGGATDTQVLFGVTYSSAINGQTFIGTMPNINVQNITPSTGSQFISRGYHNGTGSVAGDAALLPSNIKSGIIIFGVNGSAAVASGAATDPEVLSGVTYSSTATGQTFTGTMPIITPQTITPSTAPQPISLGYHDGTGSVAGDADLVAGNIKSDVAIFGVTGTYTGPAAPFPVAKTGQTLCYNNTVTASCTELGFPGQDGALQKGVTWSPGTRFVVSNGTVTDKLTGLVWLADIASSCTSGLDWAGLLAWTATLENGVCGLADGSTAGQWRLPNIKELSSLRNTTYLGFGAWSSTPYVIGPPGYVWYAGNQLVLPTDVTYTFFDARPVKATAVITLPVTAPVAPIITSAGTRFTNNGNGTVTDSLTGLIWLRNANCFGAQTWAASLVSANGLANSACGLTDGSIAGQWRLPNSNELQSLLDYTDASGLPDGGAIFVSVQSGYWSSTTDEATPSQAFSLDLFNPGMNSASKGGNASVWPVRGGL